MCEYIGHTKLEAVNLPALISVSTINSPQISRDQSLFFFWSFANCHLNYNFTNYKQRITVQDLMSALVPPFFFLKEKNNLFLWKR